MQAWVAMSALGAMLLVGLTVLWMNAVRPPISPQTHSGLSSEVTQRSHPGFEIGQIARLARSAAFASHMASFPSACRC